MRSRVKKYKESLFNSVVVDEERPLESSCASLQNATFEEVDLIRSICKDSFYDFVIEFWNTIVPETFENNWHIPYLCAELQAIAERVFSGSPKQHDLIINIPPGTSKSTIVSILFNAWVWTRMPHAGFIGASNTHSLAVEMSRKTRTVIKSDKYMRCFPEVRIITDQDAKSFFVTSRGGIRISAGVDADIIGRHADFIVIDDPINPKGARSEADTISANIFINETLWTRKKNKAVTPMITIMQRLSENDCTGMMLREWKRVKHICIPAEIRNKAVVKPESLKSNYIDGLMDIHRLNWDVLEEARNKGEYFYSGQMLQSPIPIGGALFNVEKFSIQDFPPDKWEVRMRYWDKAGTKDAGMFTVGVLLGKDKEGRFWVLDVIRGQWDTYTRERMILQTANLDGRGIWIGIEQEPGSGGKESAENSVKNLAGFRVRLDKPSGDKAQRADPYSTQVNAGNVYLKKARWNKDYIDELRYFSLDNSKYKDQVDASSGAFKFVSKKVPFAGGWKL